ncbi:MAG: molybdopterin-guanine dinucleotide biosynthesis protein MobA [Paenibacillus sp.]|jgi:molybdopterin-guanine dinucleotide biosynthesis protein A|uniref:molybdenum cofactor guanylyltransferase n=1 Tax=Paenibacillus sp. GCM10012303 TaxID=3317340 RepID=UPI0029F071BB|nr:molybdopterin-guanine dinucleotide biosynthesis protein MobA [Paenibacillus sp.]
MLTGVILAGGENRRMGGKHKALLDLGGQTLIERQIAAMSTICPELIVVTNDPKRFLPVVDRSVRIITDFYPGKGPLGGIHAALSLTRNDNVWIVGCDMPYVSPEAAGLLLERLQLAEADAAIPHVDGRLQPLHAVYNRRCAEQAAALLAEEAYRVTGLLERVRWEPVHDFEFEGRGIGTKFAVNTNTPEEWSEVLLSERSLPDTNNGR